MATINGAPVNFAFQGARGADGSQGINITGVTGVLLQGLEQTANATRNDVIDSNGNDVTHVWSNQKRNASLEWILSGASLADTLTGVSTSLKQPGSFVAITGCTSAPNLVGLSWEVQDGVKIVQSNTGAAKITFPISYAAGITGAAS